jgi:two-component system sensor histidine kinase/response regulator
MITRSKACAMEETRCKPRPDSRLHILLAEDNALYQRTIVEVLKKQGFTVRVAGNGLEALQALRQEAFDLVLMDLEMPLMGGLEAAAAIRASQHVSRNTPIIAVTSCASPADRQRCFAAGMNEHVAKPFRVAVLLETMRTVLEGNPEAAPRADVFSYQAVVERVDGNLHVLREITQMFLEDSPKWLGEIRASIQLRNASGLRMAAHTLSGAVANFGASSAHRAAHALEAMGRASSFLAADDAFSTLEREVRQLQTALTGLLETSIP